MIVLSGWTFPDCKVSRAYFCAGAGLNQKNFRFLGADIALAHDHVERILDTDPVLVGVAGGKIAELLPALPDCLLKRQRALRMWRLLQAGRLRYRFPSHLRLLPWRLQRGAAGTWGGAMR